MTTLSTHVLDTAKGQPAGGVPVQLRAGDTTLAETVTDTDGRAQLGDVDHGSYRLIFDTSTHSTFFPEVAIAFDVTDDRHHHVPLLLSPFAYSTYRGS